MAGTEEGRPGEANPPDVHGVLGQRAVGGEGLALPLPGLHQQVGVQVLSHPACVDV